MSSDLTSIRVLHVDDEPGFAEMVADCLEREDDRLAVETATDVSGGLDQLRDTEYDCIVSDYEMPNKNGLEFLEMVRNEYSDLPFILYTGKGSEEVASDAISAGVTDYLQKKSTPDQYTILANRITNVVEKSRAQQALTERTRQLETLISNLPGMVYRCRNKPTWPMEAVEGEVERLTGYSADALETDEVLWGEEILHPDDREPMWEAVQEGLAGDGTFEVTYRIITRDGTTKWMWERGRGVYSEAGELKALEGFITDITDRKEREHELEQTNAVLSTLFETLPVGVLAEDSDRTVLAVNERMFDLFDLSGSPAEIVGADCEEMAGEVKEMFVDSEQFVERINQLITKRESVRNEGLSLQDGRKFSRDHEPIELPEGKGHLWVYQDITERIEREQELERYEAIVENTEDGIYVFDTDGRFRFVNQRVVDVSGIPFDAWIGEHVSIHTDLETLTEAEVAAIESGIDAIVTGTETEVRVEVTPDVPDDLGHLEIRLTPFQTDAGDDRVIGFSRDISERKRREQKLQRQNERFDEFASVVSHDLRNPLDVAQGRLELVKNDVDNEHLDAIARAHDRMEALIHDLLTLARTGETDVDMDALSLADIAESCWHTVETADATLVSGQDCTFRADRSRCKQLLENLIRNAVEHGGTDVTVRVGELDDERGFYVADDGSGIPGDERDQIFDAGYSTTTDGTGFGLSIVKQVVDAHGWDITVTDSDDGGTRFEITAVEIVD